MSGGLLGVAIGIGKAQRKGQMITWFSAAAPSNVQTDSRLASADYRG